MNVCLRSFTVEPFEDLTQGAEAHEQTYRHIYKTYKSEQTAVT